MNKLCIIFILLATLGLPVATFAVEPQPLTPSEMNALRQMEEQSNVDELTGGDFSEAAKRRATYIQYGITIGLALLAIGVLFLGVQGVSRMRALSAAKGDEQRRWKRYALKHDANSTIIQPLEDDHKRVVGRAVDISKQGIGLEVMSEGALKKGQTIDLDIILRGAKKMRLPHLKGTVCWAAGKKVGVRLNKSLDLSTLDSLLSVSAQPMAVQV